MRQVRNEKSAKIFGVSKEMIDTVQDIVYNITVNHYAKNLKNKTFETLVASEIYPKVVEALKEEDAECMNLAPLYLYRLIDQLEEDDEFFKTFDIDARKVLKSLGKGEAEKVSTFSVEMSIVVKELLKQENE